MIIVINNHNSFVENLARYVRLAGKETCIYLNDEITTDEIIKQKPEAIIISPGPCRPNEAGISKELIKKAAPTVPILGVCLGHQAIGEVFGGEVIKSPDPMHGRSSEILHDGTGLFREIPSPFQAGRYHSLTVMEAADAEFFVTARTPSGEIMAIKHKKFAVYGVQFHPESILTPYGDKIIGNFLKEII